jgi:hypothetical protein
VTSLPVLDPLVVRAPGVLANDTDTGGQMTAVLVSPSGQLAFRPDGSFTYRANLLFIGTDTFRYRAQDPEGNQSGVATVRIRVRLL